MTKPGIFFRILVLAGASAGGWFTAPYWQAQPALRSAVRLLFRSAAPGNGSAAAAPLTLEGVTFSVEDLGDPASLRTLLTRLKTAAWSASPQEAETFVLTLTDRISQLPPSDLRALAVTLARDRELIPVMDDLVRTFSSRMVSKDMEFHLSLTLANIIQRDPDRMLLLADALPPSLARDEFLSRSLQVLATERPKEVIALLWGAGTEVRGGDQSSIAASAFYTLSCQSFGDAVTVWNELKFPYMKNDAARVMMTRINAEPDKVFAWLARMPEEERGNFTASAMEAANPEVARKWLATAPQPTAGDAGWVMACGRLAESDPATAMRLLAKMPSLEGVKNYKIARAMGNAPIPDLLAALPSLPPDMAAQLLPAALGGKSRPAEDLRKASAAISDPDIQARMGSSWSLNHLANPADGVQQTETLPYGPARETALSNLGQRWSQTDPTAWLAWMRTASDADQTAAMTKVDPAVWANPENAEFLTVRPAAEQLPYLEAIYHYNAGAAADAIERASAQGASQEALDDAARSLANSWQDRDPATARAFALSLPDPAMADRVLLGLATDSSTPDARAEAVAAIQDPVNRQEAERQAALRAIGIRTSTSTPKK